MTVLNIEIFVSKTRWNKNITICYIILIYPQNSVQTPVNMQNTDSPLREKIIYLPEPIAIRGGEVG